MKSLLEEIGGDYVQFIKVNLDILTCDGATDSYSTFAGDLWRWDEIDEDVRIAGGVGRLTDNWLQPGHGEQCRLHAFWKAELIKTSADGLDRLDDYLSDLGIPPDPVSGFFRIWGAAGDKPYKDRLDITGDIHDFSVLGLSYTYTDSCDGDGFVEEEYNLLGDLEEGS